MKKLLLGITMGCPVGIGPEIILRLHRELAEDSEYYPVVLGDPEVLDRCRQELGIEVELVEWRPGEEITAGAVNVLPITRLGRELLWGRPTAVTGRAMIAYIEEAVRLCRSGVLAGMTTCPIAKVALKMAGSVEPGHTEMLARLTSADEFAMMMAGHRLRVTLVTIHVGLGRVIELLTPEKITHLIELTGRSLQRDFGLVQPRLAVAGLNPHAGEEGMFGDEEGRLIGPAVRRAQEQGWQVTGPLPPDTVFHRAAAGAYDAVICMYHDQGLIPFKLLHFEDGVNVTLGLPIVRTSVDHGTAYDIAGRGLASAASLAAALCLAGKIAANRLRFAERRKVD